MTTETPAQKPEISLAALMGVFFRVGMASFGGATAAFLHREIVQQRRLMSEEEFLAALTISQVMPGANPVNMAIYLGAQLRGGLGGFVAVLGLVGPPFVVILILGALYERFGSSAVVQGMLAGVVAIGVAMVLQLGVQLAKSIRRFVPAVIAAVIFVLVGLLNWPMIPVVLVLAPVSVAFEVYIGAKAGDG